MTCNIPVWLFVGLCILSLIGVAHLFIYIIVLIEGLIGYKENEKADNKCPYFIEGDDDE